MMILLDIVQAANPQAIWRYVQEGLSLVAVFMFVKACVLAWQAFNHDRAQGNWQHGIVSSVGIMLVPTMIGMLSVLFWNIQPPPMWQ
jgi:hypothetical protein